MTFSFKVQSQRNDYVLNHEIESLRLLKLDILKGIIWRYCLLSYILCIRRFSSRLKKRFPDMQVLDFESWFVMVWKCFSGTCKDWDCETRWSQANRTRGQFRWASTTIKVKSSPFRLSVNHKYFAQSDFIQILLTFIFQLWKEPRNHN